MAEILVVDDDTASRDVIVESLERDGHRVASARSGRSGKDAIANGTHEIVVTDLVMPEVDGMAVLEAAKARDSSTEVIIMTGYGSVESAVEAMKNGAYQYLNKPVNIAELREVVRKALEKQSLARDNAALLAINHRYGFESLVGESKPMQEMFARIRQIAPTSATVLITGESGTGKELVAHAIHNNSPRRGKPFLAFNCGALTESLIESELFGHDKGAFTGAVSDRKGYFQLADGGTLLLDEIGEMPLHTQVKLLRVLETRSFFRVGGSRKIEVDVRVLAATNRDLEEMVKKGVFREDLYFRLNVLSIRVPRLAEHPDDVPILAQRFVEEFNRRHGRSIAGFTDVAMNALRTHAWPGNVREFRNLIENLVITAPSERIDLSDLPASIAGSSAASRATGFSFPEGMTMDEIEKAVIRIALERSGGSKKKAAELLGMSLRTFHRKVKLL